MSVDRKTRKTISTRATSKTLPLSADWDSASASSENENSKVCLVRLPRAIPQLTIRISLGLESAELISLIWPKALKERVEKPGELSEKKTEVIEDDTPQLLDVQTVKNLGKVVQRVSVPMQMLGVGLD